MNGCGTIFVPSKVCNAGWSLDFLLLGLAFERPVCLRFDTLDDLVELLLLLLEEHADEEETDEVVNAKDLKDEPEEAMLVLPSESYEIKSSSSSMLVFSCI